MKRSTLIALALVAVPAATLPFFGTQTYAADPGDARLLVAQQAVEAKSAPPSAVTIPKGINGAWAIDPQHSRIALPFATS
jgi:hypothetical protein